MRGGTAVVVILGIVGLAATLVLRKGEPSASSDAATERPPVARTRGSAPAAPRSPPPRPRGDLRLSGIVELAERTDEEVTITAYGAPVEQLDTLPCPCEGETKTLLLEAACDCDEAIDALFECAAAHLGEGEPVATAAADREGRFELEGLSPEPVTIWAESPTLGATRLEKVAPGRSDLRLALGHGHLTRGRVVEAIADHHEEPKAVPGAPVAAVSAALGRSFLLTSGADGRFELPALPRAPLVFAARVEGVGRARAHEEADGRVLLALARPRTVRLLVTRDRQPVAGARIEVRERTVGRTGADGTLTFAAPRWGLVRAIDEQGGAGGERHLGGEDELEIALAPTGGLAGSVRDAEGRPIAGADVRCDRASTRTDAAGAYAFPAVWEPCHVGARAEGYLDGGALAKPEPGRTVTVDVTLEPGALVAGQVVAPEGAPVEGAEVVATTLVAGRDAGESTRSGADGTFSLRVRPGDYRLRVMHPRFRPGRVDVRAPAQGVEVRLETGWTIAGVVIGEDGRPVAGAQLALFPLETFGTLSRGRGMRDDVTTDRSGTFSFEGLTDGQYRVFASTGDARRPFGDAGHSAMVAVEVNGASPPPVRVVFDRGLSLRGRVVDESGGGVPEAIVSATGKRPQGASVAAVFDAFSMGQVRSGADGSFEITGLRDVDHEVWVTADRYWGSPERTSVRPSVEGTPVKLTLTRKHSASGRVVGPDGAPVLKCRVNGESCKDGSFVAEFPPPASTRAFALEVSADGFPPKRVPVEARDRDVDVGVIQLTLGRSVRVVALDAASGVPIAGAQVRMQAAQGVTNAEGIAEFEGIGDEPVRTFVEARGYCAAEADGATGDRVEVRLAEAAKVRGRLAAPAGAALGGLDIDAVGPKAASAGGQTARDGTFELEACAPGTWRVRVPAHVALPPGLYFRATTVEVPPQGTVSVTLQAEPASRLMLQVTTASGRRPSTASLLVLEGEVPLPRTREAWSAALKRTLWRGMLRDDEGLIAAGAIPSGRHTLLVMASDGPLDDLGLFQMPIAVPAPATVDVRLPAKLEPHPLFAGRPGTATEGVPRRPTP